MNIEDYERKLEHIPDRLENELTGETGALVLIAISGYAKNLAHYRTGEMRNSIHELTAQKDGDSVTYKVIAGAPQSVWEEYGIGRLGDPSVPHNPEAKHPREPHVFMRPAIGIDADGSGRTNLPNLKAILQGAISEVFEQ